MLTTESYQQLKTEIRTRILEDRSILDQLRREIVVLRPGVRRIQPRTATSISLVAADGGNNRIQYDPFLMQLVRVVDSSNNELCLEVVTPNTKMSAKSAEQFNVDGTPKTALGYMMDYLGVRELTALSEMINTNGADQSASPYWIDVYRELVEWAMLFRIIRTTQFGSDTLIVYDGLLRSRVFARDLFMRYREGMQDAIDQHYARHRRRLYLVGIAKHNKVLTRYRLAMALEKILDTDYAAYVEVPRDLERRSYIWKDFVGENDDEQEANRVVGGKLFFVKFGDRPTDPIWPIDILFSQRSEAAVIIGHLLADAQNGFPIPFYPLCLQKAHDNAALVDFDFDILQDQIFDSIRAALGHEAAILDRSRIQDEDPARARYGG